MKAVVVLGSINMDLVVRTERFPHPGETLTGRTFYTAPGGKGANQAVAAARLGVPTRMVGRVGKDVFGNTLLASLKQDGVNVAAVQEDAEQPSGTAVIMVDDKAENEIVIVAGANGAVCEADLDQLRQMLPDAGQLLLQLEVPMDTVLAAARLAHEQDVTVIFDPAPVRPLPDALYPYIDILTPNESEAAALVGFAVNDEASAAKAAQVLLGRGARQVVIKMGGRGAYWHDGQQAAFLPAYKVNAVDTVAAGDAFNGALAAALAEGLPVQEALRWGMAGGAISTTRIGAQPSLASREELLALLEKGKI
jgi:ribokinase